MILAFLLTVLVLSCIQGSALEPGHDSGHDPASSRGSRLIKVQYSTLPILKHKRDATGRPIYAPKIHIDLASLSSSSSSGSAIDSVDSASLSLALHRNDALISPGYQYMTGSSNDAVQTVRSTPPVNCFYTGSVHGRPESLVAVSLCDGVSGMIHVDESTRYSIQPQPSEHNQAASDSDASAAVSASALWESRLHVLTLEVDEQPASNQDGQSASEMSTGPSCGVLHPPGAARFDPLDVLEDGHQSRHRDITPVAVHHPILPPTLAQSAWVGPNNTRQTIELFIANDFQRLQQWGPALVEQSTLEIVNIVHAMYTRVNVYPEPYTLGVTIAGIFTATEPMWFPQNTSTVDGGSLLSNFRSWWSGIRANASLAGTALAGADAAHLFSGRLLSTASNPNPTGPSLLGMAYVGALCNSWSCGVNYISRTARLSNTATVVAHELGHNAGASHDTQGNNCTSGFLMNPSTCLSCSTHATNFSSCSADYMSSYFRSGLQCLNNVPQTCGNGILDAGEECDSGNRRTGNACCTETCRLRPNAQCDASMGLCCNPSTCRLRPIGTACRAQGTNFPNDAPRSACDVADVCSGTSAKCPDVIAANGTVCQVSGTIGACNAGVCESRALACTRASRVYNATCDALAPGGNQCRLMCADSVGRCVTLTSGGLAVNVSNHMWCPGASGAVDGLGRCMSGQCRNVTGRWIVGEAASGQLVNGTPVFPLPTNTNSTSTPTDSATNPPTQPADGSQGASAAVIGGAVGGVAAVGAASGALVWFKWYRVRSLGMAAANSGSMALMSVGNMAGRGAGA